MTRRMIFAVRDLSLDPHFAETHFENAFDAARNFSHGQYVLFFRHATIIYRKMSEIQKWKPREFMAIKAKTRTFRVFKNVFAIMRTFAYIAH